jgi:CDP-4-dehydro-6-deoxyglucose reductase
MSFKVLVEPSGQSFFIEPDETILEAALRHGFSFPYGCRDGACGACKGKVIEGELNFGTYSPAALSEQEKQSGLALFCQAKAKSDLRVEVHEVGAMEGIEIRTLRCRVEKLVRATHNVMIMYLKLPANQRLRFLAGQYIDFLLADGRRRSFSIANAPHNDEFIELHIRYVGGGDFTDYVFNELKEKTLMRIQGPLGSFFLREDSDRPTILMAGGTGIAPIKSLLEHAQFVGVNRPIFVYWGVRTKQDLYMEEFILVRRAQMPNLKYVAVLSDPEPEDHWHGRIGYVQDAVLEDFNDLSHYDVYACGPPAMVYSARDAFRAKGLPEDHYYSDAFEFQEPKHKAVKEVQRKP